MRIYGELIRMYVNMNNVFNEAVKDEVTREIIGVRNPPQNQRRCLNKKSHCLI